MPIINQKKKEKYNFYLRYGFYYNLFSFTSKYHRSKTFLLIILF